MPVSVVPEIFQVVNVDESKLTFSVTFSPASLYSILFPIRKLV